VGRMWLVVNGVAEWLGCGVVVNRCSVVLNSCGAVVNGCGVVVNRCG
jgi:hypothetical protein